MGEGGLTRVPHPVVYPLRIQAQGTLAGERLYATEK